MARTTADLNDIVYVWRVNGVLQSTCVAIATFDSGEYVGEMTLREYKAMERKEGKILTTVTPKKPKVTKIRTTVKRRSSAKAKQ